MTARFNHHILRVAFQHLPRHPGDNARVRRGHTCFEARRSRLVNNRPNQPAFITGLLNHRVNQERDGRLAVCARNRKVNQFLRGIAPACLDEQAVS